MKPSPSSLSGLALLLLAGVLAITAPAPVDRTGGEVIPTGANRSKRQPPTAPGSEDDSLAWLERIIQTTKADSWKLPSTGQLRSACQALPANAIAKLLGHPALKLETAYADEESWNSFVKLLPLREMLLRRLALLDLRRALGEFPSDAELLVREAARRDGVAALGNWLAAREGWRQQPRSAPPDADHPPIFGIGFVPRIESPSDEQRVMNGLVEGWASSNAEAAWNSLRSGYLEAAPLGMMDGLITGLPESSNWELWSKRLLSMATEDPDPFELDPLLFPLISLAERWMSEEPEAAFAWFKEREASWTEPFRGSVSAPDYAFTLGGTGSTPFISARSSLFSRWLHHEPDVALEWMARAGVSDRDLVRDIVQWTDTPDLTKVRLMGQLEDSEEIQKLAAILAGRQKQRATPWKGHEIAREKLTELLASLDISEGTTPPLD